MSLPVLLAAQVKLDQAPQQATLSGGTGSASWKMRFMRVNGEVVDMHLAQVSDSRCWMSHGPWLRLIDTRQGIVLGRWRFPGVILRVTPRGQNAEVEIESSNDPKYRARQTILLDPQSPRIPNQPNDDLWTFRVAKREGVLTEKDPYNVDHPISSDQARRGLAEVEDMVRRDPLSPWFRVALAHLYDVLADSRKQQLLEQAVRMPNLDFTELLPLSTHLEDWGQPALSREAFERGYRDYLDRGYDPRLHTWLISRLVILQTARWDRLSPTAREEQMERIYRFSPAAEGAHIAWEIRVRELEGRGQTEEARAWSKRIEEAAKVGIALFDWTLGRIIDVRLLILESSVLFLFLVVIHRYFCYRAQQRLDATQRARSLALFAAEYWSRSERVSFLAAVVTVLLMMAILGGFAAEALVTWSAPASVIMGSLAGPRNRAFFQSFPATPERDLLLAIGWQQEGEPGKAEPLYRALPEFAQSWNNLGVILKQQGKETDAKQAFERALQIDPGLHEASLNLAKDPRDLWTRQFQSYFPGRPMIAPPTVQQTRRAFSGGGFVHSCFRAVMHPVQISRGFLGPDAKFGYLLTIVFALGTLVLIWAILHVFWLPQRDVTLPPGKREWIWALLFPGLGREWGLLGSPITFFWIYLVLQLGLFLKLGTPYVATFTAMPNLVRSYGVMTGPMLRQLGGVNPGWGMLFAAPAVLFAINALLVLRSRRK